MASAHRSQYGSLLMSAKHVDVHPIGSQPRPRTRSLPVAKLALCVFVAELHAAGCSSGGYRPPVDDKHGTDGGVSDLAITEPGHDGGTLSDGGMGSWDLLPDLMAPPTSDPFDPASCPGPAWSAASALTTLGTAARAKLADATLMRRTRTCTGTTPATCGAWSTPIPHTQALLTYSGGVTTDYKTFSFPTHLILFAQSGQPKLVVRHESDYRHDATANTRGVVFPLGAFPIENTYPVIYVWDFAPAPYRYDDLQGLLGGKGQLFAAERCARAVFTDGLTTEIAALYRY